MSLPQIPQLSTLQAQFEAQAKLGRWTTDPATPDLFAEIANQSIDPRKDLDSIRRYIAAPTRFELEQSGQRSQPWIGHKGAAYCTTIVILRNRIVGVMDTKKIGNVMGRGMFSVVGPTGVPEDGESMIDAARREVEEEIGVNVDVIVPTSIAPHPVLPSRHFGIECHTFIAGFSGPLTATARPRDRSEKLFVWTCGYGEWIEMMLDGGILEEGTIAATMAAMPHVKELRQQFMRVCEQRALSSEFERQLEQRMGL